MYALYNLYYFAMVAGTKSGAMVQPAVQTMAGAIVWWQVALWAAAIVGYAIAAIRYLRGGKALIPLGVAFIIDVGLVFSARGMAGYSAQDQQTDMLCLAGVLVALLITWWQERSAGAAAAAA